MYYWCFFSLINRLTAFVLKSFVQGKPYIFIDDAIITKMVDWIVNVKYQNQNGSFWEPGRVIHKAMQVNKWASLWDYGTFHPP